MKTRIDSNLFSNIRAVRILAFLPLIIAFVGVT